MAFDVSTFETLTPSLFIEFATTNTINCSYLRTPRLRIAILDSPEANVNDDSPKIGVMIVPEHRETDWVFCTESGHLQLLFHLNVSRLILVGNNLDPNTEPSVYIRPPVMNPVDMDRILGVLQRLLVPLHPKLRSPKTLISLYEDDVVYRVIIERFVGSCVGEFVVEDVVLESKQFRRGLQFKTIPNVIQSHVPLIPKYGDSVCNLRLDLESLRKLEGVEFLIDTRVLLEPYLNAMVSGIFLIVSPLNERNKLGFSPRALCLGVGGGSLLSFLNTQLGFEVVGVEIDEVVLTAARKYFGLNDLTSVRLIVGDAIELISKVACDSGVNNTDGLNAKFDVVMVDLVSKEARSRITAPPPEFVSKRVLQATGSLLHDHGVVIIHAVPPNKLFYATLIPKLRDVFHKVYEIDPKRGHSFVLVATLMTPIAADDHANAFLKRLRSVISGSYSIWEM